MRPVKAVIPAAGLGTRLLPATKSVPKEMLPLVDIPALHIIAEECANAGITQLILVSAVGKTAMEDYFDKSYRLEETLAAQGKMNLLVKTQALLERIEVISIRQREPRGLGHAVLTARAAVGDAPFAVLLPDDIFDADPPAIGQLCDVYEATSKGCIALLETPGEEHRYGIVKGKPTAEDPRRWNIEDMVEKPKAGTAPSSMAIMGRYVLPGEIFDILEKTPPGAGNEIQLTDAMRVLCLAKGMHGYQYHGTRYDTGTALGFLKANLAYAWKRPEMRQALAETFKALLDGKPVPQ
jgi:UTP--glucose-1-phosphate uridylyltransferase